MSTQAQAQLRILCVTQYFPPEVGAPQTRLAYFVDRAREYGHQVRVLTAMPSYPEGVVHAGYRGRLYVRQRAGESGIRRAWSYVAPGGSTRTRLMNQISFALTAGVAVLLGPRADVCLVESPPLFLAVGAGLACRVRGIPVVLNVADLWPDAALALGKIGGATHRLGLLLERLAYRLAGHLVAPTEGLADHLRHKRAHRPIAVVFNGADTTRFVPHPRADGEVKRVIYAGSVGLVHGVDTLIDALDQVGGDGADIELVVAGQGADWDRVKQHAERRGLSNVSFLGKVPHHEMPELLASCDIGVVTLRPIPFFDMALPVKMFEYLAAGLPTVYAGQGEGANVLRDNEAGFVVAPGDSPALAGALRRLLADPQEREKLSMRGRRLAVEHFDRAVSARRLEAVLLNAARRDGAPDLERVYRGYEGSARKRRSWSLANRGNAHIVAEAWGAVIAAMPGIDSWEGSLGLLDVGCGTGDFLAHLVRRGVPPDRLHGVEFLPWRAREAAARASFDIRVADARRLPYPDESFAAVSMMTLLSSLPAPEVREGVLREALRVLRKGGALIAYDTRFPNPLNRNTRHVGRAELRAILGDDVRVSSLTLVPPLARTVARSPSVYRRMASLPLLRSHLLAVYTKPQRPESPGSD